MRLPFPRSGLYAITREAYPDEQALFDAVAAAIRGGAAVIQYRAKTPRDPLGETAGLLAICRAAGVPLIINDDVDLARRIGADGVHLGKEDMSLTEARATLWPDAIVGVSCYDSVDLAIQAETCGASYVAFGRFFPSKTKPDAPCARLETLAEAKSRLRIPIVAIGGITPENGGLLLKAGADLLAVIEAVFGAPDPGVAAAAFLPLFSESKSESAVSEMP
ncbi:thiamine phosphate synthase [Methylocaldum szegediense]|uniref:Thiamine-phosphate synthase n=1 Tax=Methylocaldum szegediense TaxID=73780 RepID=A0ABM9I5H8_9GAMM|nr:thiamine phosphate synthase [Methylocaldum szegediense]CAI8905434.1 Thiamine-phosphate synthase [Methylocaldum szegediense]